MTEPTTAVLLRRLPPAICGVGDYTWNLWRQLAPGWRFLVTEGADETGKLEDAPPLKQITKSDGAVANALNGADTLIVQYTPYGFDPSGAPGWLVDGIERWINDDRRLIVMFHESFAVSPPWKRSFWKAGGQKKVIRRLGELADVCLTSTDWFREQLDECDIEARLCPVPSNIPQVQHVPRDGEGLRVVTFGQAQSRHKAMQRHHGLMVALQNAGRLDELVIIGEPSDQPEATFTALENIDHKGVIPAQEVAETLAQCDLLLCAHPPEEMRKSGSTAGALSNGCAVAVHGEPLEDSPPAVFYEEPDAVVESLTRERLTELSKRGHEWYQTNASWDSCVNVWKDILDATAT